MKHYLTSAEDVIKTVGSNEDGLNSSEAAKRLEKNGKNKLKQAEKDSFGCLLAYYYCFLLLFSR